MLLRNRRILFVLVLACALTALSAEPLDFADKLVGRVDDATMRKVMRSNVAELVKHG